jgi:putative FmdB family regulatory protein
MVLLECVPTYEYECRQCRRRFEVRQRISEPALSTCEECGGPVQRLLAATPFILKGGGWYVTDYPSADRQKALSGESNDKPSTGSEVKSGTTAETSSSSSASTASGESSKPSATSKDSGESSKPSTTSKDSGESSKPSTTSKDSAKPASDT